MGFLVKTPAAPATPCLVYAECRAEPGDRLHQRLIHGQSGECRHWLRRPDNQAGESREPEPTRIERAEREHDACSVAGNAERPLRSEVPPSEAQRGRAAVRETHA